MDNFIRTKRVSLWGIGYLGYTTLLQLQDSGILVTIADLSGRMEKKLISKEYPNHQQISSWSKSGKVPSIDISKVEVGDEVDKMFQNSIHIISFPNSKNGEDYKKLAELFLKNLDKLNNPLIIFQSAGEPNGIQENFLNYLNGKLKVDAVTLFRSDWSIEEFVQKSQRFISGTSEKAIERAEEFLKFLDIKPKRLSSIEEAEIFENVKNGLSYTISAFFNQLSLAYSHIDFEKLSKMVLEYNSFQNISIGVTGVDYKSEQSIENIFKKSEGNFLSILQEANRTNISFLFYYTNLLKQKGIESVTIMGLSSFGTIRDLKFSPSLILAEYLQKEGVKVEIYDSNFSFDEVAKILPNLKKIQFQEINSEAVILMHISNSEKFLTQKDIEDSGVFKAKYIFDNVGFFEQYSFSNSTIYHKFGDGNLQKVKK